MYDRLILNFVLYTVPDVPNNSSGRSNLGGNGDGVRGEG